MRIWHEIQAGHSVRVRPNPFPNLEVKPDVAVVLLRCESPWEATVLAFSISNQSFNIDVQVQGYCQIVVFVVKSFPMILDF